PASTGVVHGTIRTPSGNAYTGANVIARNVAAPFGDAISAISGDHSQGGAGADGDYTLAGVPPGASYAPDVDGIVAGAFSTPLGTLLPGPEEYWNGDSESADGKSDDRCAATPIVPVAGSPTQADVSFNRVAGAPTFTAIDMPNSWISSLSGDG